MRIRKIIFATLIILIALVAGILIGAKSNIVSGSTNNQNFISVPLDLQGQNIDMSEFWQVWRTILAHSPQADKISSQEMVWGATKGLVDSLGDPYTIFLPPKENANLNLDLSGQFSGVGMEVGIKGGVLTVVAPLKDSPAEKAGIKAGDLILKINDTVTTDLSIDEAVELIRGKEGTEVIVTIARKGLEDTKDIKMTRDLIKIPVIETEDLKSDKVFLIKFYQFGESANEDFQKALTEFKNSGEKNLIIDLRNNPGGYLSAAVDITSWFLPEGKVIVSEKGKDPENDKVYRSGGHFLEGKYKVVILINGGSASASEIMAGALQEHGIAKLVGTQTFGKGSVQELVPLKDKTALKLTIANWYTPNGVSISKQGLKPDYVVEFDAEKYEKSKIDTQLQKAIEVVKGK